jgi:uncharacterized membrane-anchored protein
VTSPHDPRSVTDPRTGVPRDERLAGRPSFATMLNKVPEVTIYFWIIKVLCTTVGETAADFMNDTLGFGLNKTSLVMSGALLVTLFFQFRARRYVPGIYWLAVVLISIVGTLLSDKLVDDLGVPLWQSTVAFAIALGITFTVWYSAERTLSIHTIVTRRREVFYWLAVLFTFALGTSAGDLFAEQFGIGYWATALIVAVLIAVIAAAHRFAGLDAVLAFWMAYILTRPLGASIGDGMSQPQSDGGLGLGTTLTSAIFLAVILALVLFLAVTGVDRTETVKAES